MLEALSPDRPAPREVFLYGDAPWRKMYENLLAQAGVINAGRLAKTGPKWHWPVGGSLPLKFAKERPDIPIIVIGNGSDNPLEMDFVGCIRTLTHDEKITNKILHPAFLCHHIPLQLGNHNTLFSFPGSGTQLAAFLIRELSHPGLQPSISPNSPEAILCNMAGNHLRALYALADVIADSESKRGFSQFIPSRGYLTFQFQEDDGKSFSEVTCPAVSHIAPPLFKTHERIDSSSDAFYRKFTNKAWLCHRNPLDVLISYHNKGKASHLPREVENSNEMPIADIALSGVLHNMPQFKQVARIIRDYYQGARSVGIADQIIRYETALEDPLTYIRQIGEGLDVDLSDKDCDSLWQKFGFKPLGDLPSLWKPGREKWKSLLSSEHAAILSELGYPDLLNEMGYPVDIEPDGNVAVPDNTLSFKAHFAWKQDIRYLGAVSELHKDSAIKCWGDREQGLQVYGNSPLFNQRLKDVFADPLNVSLLRSGLP